MVDQFRPAANLALLSGWLLSAGRRPGVWIGLALLLAVGPVLTVVQVSGAVALRGTSAFFWVQDLLGLGAVAGILSGTSWMERSRSLVEESGASRPRVRVGVLLLVLSVGGATVATWPQALGSVARGEMTYWDQALRTSMHLAGLAHLLWVVLPTLPATRLGTIVAVWLVPSLLTTPTATNLWQQLGLAVLAPHSSDKVGWLVVAAIWIGSWASHRRG